MLDDKKNNPSFVAKAECFFKKEEEKKGVWIVIKRLSEAVKSPPASSLYWGLHSPRPCSR